MNLISSLDILSLLVLLYAAWFLFTRRTQPLFKELGYILGIILACHIFTNFSNVLQWSGITMRLDMIEDYIEALLPILWLQFIYMFMHFKEKQVLQESQDKFRSLADNSPSMIFINRRGSVVYCNKMCEITMGYKRSELLAEGFNFRNLISAESLPLIEENLKRHMDSEEVEPYEYKLVAKDGTYMDSIITTRLIKYEGEDAILGVVTDISKQKSLEAEILQNVQKLKLHFEQAPLGFIEWDTKFRATQWNPMAEKIFGYKKAEALGKIGTDLIVPKEAWSQVHTVWENLLEKKGSIRSTNKNVTKNGDTIDCEWYNTPLVNNEGSVIGVASLVQDITKQLATTEALRESEIKYRKLIESANDAIFLADKDTGILVDVNSAATELVGKSRAELIGVHQATLHPAADKDFYSSMFKSDATREPGSHNIAYVEHKDKRRIPVQISATPIELNGKNLIMGIFRDITNLKTIEDSLRKDKNSLAKIVEKKTKDLSVALKSLEDRKRLSDIGELSATVAHELRNPLGVINAAVYNIKKKSSDKSLQTHISTIEKKITESDQIIKNLLTYSRIRVPKFQTINIARFFDEILDGLKSRYSDWDLKIEIDSKFKDTDTLQCDPVQLNSLISNILDNACQSYNEKKCHVNIAVSLDKKHNRFELIVRDQGTGINKCDLEKIFEPFYTTKPKGTGLGLSVCKQVTTLHDGEISIDSKKGRGTSVSLSLPISRT